MTLRHNELGENTGEMLYEATSFVRIEPILQTLAGNLLVLMYQ